MRRKGERERAGRETGPLSLRHHEEAAIDIVTTHLAPVARGHYSQAVVHGGLVYVAGQLPIAPDDPARKLASFEEQARQVLANVMAILEAAGSGPGLILKSTVYIADIGHWPAFNAIYAEALGTHRPARTVVPVAQLHYGYLVEMDVIASLRDSGSASAA